ncbi:MAG: hypothetical protein ABIZ56_10440 [Chthoniobacteraceae bacterium]
MSHVPDELVTFVQVLVEDDDLRAWFESFQAASDGEREAEFRTIAAKMQAAGEEPGLIASTSLLAKPEVFRAAQVALRQTMESR